MTTPPLRRLLPSSASFAKRSSLLGIALAIGGAIAPAQADVPSSGMPFTVAGLGLEMRPIPAGTFLRGSPAGETGRSKDEGPQAQVTISKPFWVGGTDVTQGQWKSVMGTDLAAQFDKVLQDDTLYAFGDKQQTLRDHFGLAGPTPELANADDRLPMRYVSWAEAMEFCRKLTQQARMAGTLPEGYEYTLPTEAQWEYACRAGTPSATYVGPMKIVGKNKAPVLDAIAWYAGNSGSASDPAGGWYEKKWPGHQYPSGNAGVRDVGLKQPNAWGLYDMLGDLFQWCRDWYGPYPAGDATDPVGASSGPHRVIRGGAWVSTPTRCRSAGRVGDDPGFREDFVGFRLALSPRPAD